MQRILVCEHVPLKIYLGPKNCRGSRMQAHPLHSIPCSLPFLPLPDLNLSFSSMLHGLLLWLYWTHLQRKSCYMCVLGGRGWCKGEVKQTSRKKKSIFALITNLFWNEGFKKFSILPLCLVKFFSFSGFIFLKVSGM